MFLAAIASAQTDSFTRADGALGTNWQGNYTGTVNLAIVGQKVRSTAVGTTAIQTWATPVGLTQSAQVTLATLGVNGEGAVFLRVSAPPTQSYYYISATRSGASNTIIYRCEVGTCSLVDEDFSSNTWVQGDQLKATIDSNGTISIFHNGSQFRTFIDPIPLTGTYAGIGMFLYAGASLAEVELDNFDNGTTPPVTGTITWTCDRCAVTSGSAVGTAPPSLANWVIANLSLAPGANIIIVTITDSNGGISTDTITVNYVPTFPGNTLAGAWGFEAGSGTSAIDSSGNGNDATFVGTPTWVTSASGNAISFDGIDQSLTVPDPANNSLDFTQSFTISSWVNPSAIHTDYRAVMAKANSTIGGGPSYALYASVDSATCPVIGSGAVAGLIHVNGTSGPTYVVCGAPLATGIWTHLAVTYDGSNLRLYRNGVLTATTPVPSVTAPPTVSIMEPSTGALQIGASEFGEQFAGALDEPRAYNYALPITAGSNTVPGAACVRNQTPSVVGDMNCSVVPTGGILAFKIAASATGLQVGATGSLKVGSH
jgi:hypothetical protein